MKQALLILTNALPLLCAAALMLGAAALARRESPQSRAAEVHQLHQDIDKLNARLRTLEGPQR